MHTPLSISGVISIMLLQGIFTLFPKRLFFIFFYFYVYSDYPYELVIQN